MEDVNHVLAIASHVTYGYVGNKMASFVMQVLGLDVSCIDTVRYSNHLAYRQATGSKTSAHEVAELYKGLTQARLDDFGILLSGYCPGADVVLEVGRIAKAKREAARANGTPGAFFWVLDPVMGDNGRLYVGEDTVPAYRDLIRHADLILPNQFEAELLSGIKITDKRTLLKAISMLHKDHGVPHVVVTSIQFPSEGVDAAHGSLTVMGSTATTNDEPQAFEIMVSRLPAFFSGTGDMFAGLLTARLREQAVIAQCLNRASWKQATPPLSACDLPLAKAVRQVLASMHVVLSRTAQGVEQMAYSRAGAGPGLGQTADMVGHLSRTKAAEIRVVRHIDDIVSPPDTGEFAPVAVPYMKA